MTALHLAGYPASFIMGVVLGLTGSGGSILTVPILVYLFGILPVAATAHSLALVGLVALWGAWGAYKSKDLHLKSAWWFGVPGVMGVIIARRLMLPSIPEEILLFDIELSKNSLLLIVFSLIMLAAGISMIRASRNLATKSTDDVLSELCEPKTALLAFVGLLVGFIAGFVGAGGGFLIVPALVTFAKIKMRQAVGTSLFVISLQSLLGIVSDPHSLSSINVTLFFLMALLALIGMSIGTRLRHKIPSATLKILFGVFVLLMGASILIKEIS